jgi:REP element-mobilizing transposase RayT
MHNPEGMYFLSFATVGWIDVFTRPLYKDIIVESLKHCQEQKGLILHAWCIMTNHVHLIASARDNNLSDILRDMKKFTSKKLIEAISNNPEESRKEWMIAIFRNAGAYNANNEVYQFWQQNNKPIEVYSQPVVKQKLDYLHNNPVAAGFAIDPANYPYSSAYDYAGGNGPLQLALLI